MKSNSKAGQQARILIVDDHPTVREGLIWRLGREPAFEVCGEADDAQDALRVVVEHRPDVAIVDISLKTGSGIDLVRQILEVNENVRVLVWSMHPETLYADRALRAGALGYIGKDQATERVLEAIRRVSEGHIWLSESMTTQILKRNIGAPEVEQPRSPLEMLTDRELEVFRLIGRGLKTSEIAAQLRLNMKTVSTYRDRLRRKLGLRHGTELNHFATQWAMESGQKPL